MEKLNKEQIEHKHPLYDHLEDRWKFWNAAYDGIDALIQWGVIKKNDRESQGNFEARKDKAYGFNYSRSVTNIFSHYLNQKQPARELGTLADDAAWLEFQDDCDLCGNSFDVFLNQQDKNASIQGFVGILVDKPMIQVETKADELAQKLYPYITVYHPADIWDWKYKTNEQTGRPFLDFLKLVDSEGHIRIWTQTEWAVYEWNDDKKEYEEISAGSHELKEIPFVFLENIKNRKHRNIGVSDISDIARIDASIIRNLSQGEEVIDYAAFPMMRKPMRQVNNTQPDEVGVSGLLEFDPTMPESKPDWLAAEVQAPITAILTWIDKKVQEVYRCAGIAALRSLDTGPAKSGVALKQEFQELNATLCSKADNLDEAEEMIIWFWLLWQNNGTEYANIKVQRPKDFSIVDLVTDLANALTSTTVVKSDTFKKQLQKNIARAMLDGESDDLFAVIDDEIDAYKPEAIQPPAFAPKELGPGQQGGDMGNMDDNNADGKGQPAE